MEISKPPRIANPHREEGEREGDKEQGQEGKGKAAEGSKAKGDGIKYVGTTECCLSHQKEHLRYEAHVLRAGPPLRPRGVEGGA